MAFDGGPFIFRINENGSGPNLLLQFTNHIPKGSSICRKDNLARYLKCMRKVYGSIYDISPPGFNLPLEYNKLVAECTRLKQNAETCIWICKPAQQSQGKGIFLFQMLSDLVFHSNAVVQRYIENPLLIGGYKFDLRLYVCIPSYHPLTVYLYREGLVRFSTEKFSLKDLDNPFCHLTNSSLNKQGASYTKKKDCVGSGCKWTLKQLRHYLVQVGISDWLLWQRVSSLIVLTVLSQITGIPSTSNCFEFYGFDVLVDASLRPWLLEVNLSPALGNDCDVDPAVKKPMLHDLFDLLGLPVCNTGLSLFTIWSSNYHCPPHIDSDDENSENTNDSSRKLQSGIPSSNTAALSVATAASRWKRRHQQQQQQQQQLQQQRQLAVCDSKPPGGATLTPRTRKKSANHNHHHHRNTNSALVSTQGSVHTGSIPGRRSKARTAKSLAKSSSGSLYSSSSRNSLTDDDGEYINNDGSGNWIKNSLIIDRSKIQSRGFQRTKQPTPKLWGNGRDWRSPPAGEGDWVRIYPLGQVSEQEMDDGLGVPTVGDKEVRRVVAAVHRYSKTARDIWRKNPSATDLEYNTLLQHSLGFTGQVWLPPK
ncbi:probable alpha-tubulin polyglutamylase Ttll1 isoform X2 [Anabrus simplex]|uniref:probable alpha-tubulin polyglutamylase Ttll1 isoform X2 n=1 Tax=Anabrus simplex TaxID=316456 RepID=UPI0035A2924F